jgi:tagatose 6-phosphate kinase
VERIGGKGVNVARFCGRMGVGVRLVAIADESGAVSLAQEPDLALATLQVVPSGLRARTDVIAVEDDGRASVLNGTAPGPPLGVIEAAVSLLLDSLGPEDLLVLAGSLPTSAPEDLYARLIRAARAAGARSVLDASGAWLRAALAAAPDVAKASTTELAGARGVTSAEAWAVGRAVAPEPASLIVTAGRRGARLWSDGARWTVSTPSRVPVNPIGAGDALMAGLCCGLSSGASLDDALADGVAWAAAKVQDFDLSLDPGLAASLGSDVRVTRRATPGRAAQERR